ncbi:unnamed protein product [Acidithrix sp. C25]|nr:unnamed protein product [Acidithrix sp. C25]
MSMNQTSSHLILISIQISGLTIAIGQIHSLCNDHCRARIDHI